MKQQYKQLQPHNQCEQTAVIRQETTYKPATFSELAKNRIIKRHGMTEQEWAVYDAAVSIGLLTLRTAYPTQTRSYDEQEHDRLTALWLEIFVDVKPNILHDAIMFFIANDRKGFFPPPGLIMECVEEVIKKRDWKKTEEFIYNNSLSDKERKEREKNGANCSNCRFCEHREIPDILDRSKIEMGLFCQNPKSYKYEGDYGHGTEASIICSHYKPHEIPKQKNIESEVDLIER